MECRNSSGVTLIELVISLSIVLVLLTVAIPNFLDFIRSALLATQTRSFVTAVHFSRAHALKRNVRVTICVLGANHSCSDSGRWEEGWLTYVDNNRNGRSDPGEIIRVFDALKEGYRLRSNIAKESSLIFYPDGSVRKGTGGLPLMTFTLCAQDATTATIRERSREIVINATGRMRTQLGRPGITHC